MIEVLPTSTRAVVWYGRDDLRLEQHSLPELQPRDVLVEVAACGLCATDVHLVEGLIPFYKPPRVLGHETSGVVRAVGNAVRSVQPGQSVALDTSTACGTCFYCREGKPFSCPQRVGFGSGWADFQVVPDEVVYPLPDGVDLELGAFAEPLSCAVHAVEQAGLRVGEAATIIGAGAIGLLVLQVARLSGARELIVSDLDANRRELALRMGATRVVDPSQQDLLAEARQATDGLGPDRVFEAVGSAATVESAIGLPRRGGTVVVIGVAPKDAQVSLRPYELFEREITIHFSFVRTFEFRRAVALLPRLDLAPLLTHRFPLERTSEAVRAASSRVGIKIQVQPRLKTDG
jgi:2-desacetyl-2-hydroxyethyl bacteriochlorophyllide A dehydrogenase